MKVGIVAPAPVPYAPGGAERAWTGLQRALGRAGHAAEMVTRPFSESTLAEVVDGYLRFAALDLSGFDIVISSKYPAWIAPHPRHVVWMFHPLRGLYDTYHTFRLPPAVEPREPSLRALLRACAAAPERRALPEIAAAWEAAVADVGVDHPHLALPSPIGRAVVHWLDAAALSPREVVRHLALSRTVASRPGYLPPGVVPRIAYCPSDLPVAAPPSPSAPRHLFTVSRLDAAKRVELVVRAMASVPGDVPLLVGGSGPEADRLRAIAAGDRRVRFLGPVADADLPDLYAGSLAVPFTPLEEDYGLVTVEAFAAGAPVVTCDDSGGPAELVVDGSTGLVVRPAPRAVGAALARLVEHPEEALAMGAAGRRRAASITWERTVDLLLGTPRPHRAPAAGPSRAGPSRAGPSRAGRAGGAGEAGGAGGAGGAGAAGPAGRAAGGADVLSAARHEIHPDQSGTRPRRARRKIVVASTYRVSEARHGGQLRCFHLYGALARHVDVEVVALVDRPSDAGRTVMAPGFREVRIARSALHHARDEEVSLAAGVPASDIVAASDIDASPEYLAALGRALDGAEAVVLAHPYLLPALELLDRGVPFVYDAHNVEAALKATVLSDDRTGRRLLDLVRDVERRAVQGAVAVVACSPDDARTLRSLYGEPAGALVVVPNGTDARVDARGPEQRAERRARWLGYWRSTDPGRARVGHVAVFFASWHPPNLEAARVIIGLAPALPEVLFLLGGSHGDAFADGALPANVVLTGVVGNRARDDLLGLADVALNPMLSGSGTNLKVIEYLAHRAPVVSTPVGVRGLDLRDGEHLLVAPTGQLADAIRATLDDPVSAAARASAGRALVEASYDWRALGDRLAASVPGATGR
ncbi:MAG: glycosyltransferase family 4 protein [Actinobacteria bacterium]|nr:glycosyltransferase family 4 protein [Actinomycetota bacterium]